MENNEKFTQEELKSSMDKYASKYNDGDFLDFIKRCGGKVGKDLLQKAFLLYYTLKKEGVPITVKGLIMGALAYLVIPIDLIPDVIPVLGWTDDAAAVAFAISMITSYIDVNVENQAKDKVEDILS